MIQTPSCRDIIACLRNDVTTNKFQRWLLSCFSVLKPLQNKKSSTYTIHQLVTSSTADFSTNLHLWSYDFKQADGRVVKKKHQSPLHGFLLHWSTGRWVIIIVIKVCSSFCFLKFISQDWYKVSVFLGIYWLTLEIARA